jgi:hypothetical protein
MALPAPVPGPVPESRQSSVCLEEFLACGSSIARQAGRSTTRSNGAVDVVLEATEAGGQIPSLDGMWGSSKAPAAASKIDGYSFVSGGDDATGPWLRTENLLIRTHQGARRTARRNETS